MEKIKKPAKQKEFLWNNCIVLPGQILFVYNTGISDIIYYKCLSNENLCEKINFFDRIHPDDQEEIKFLFKSINIFWHKYSTQCTDDCINIKFRFSFSKEVGYKMVNCKTIIGGTNNRGVYIIYFLTDVSHLNLGDQVFWSYNGKGKIDFHHKRQTDITLTHRELDIIRFISKGYNSQQIADNLNISLYTVYTHRRNMLNRMKFKNVLQLVNYAMKKGFIYL